MNPFFSIIVPCCDVAPYLRECLDSVVKQPFSDWECLLGVEESKDDTEKIAREYAAKDPRFKVFTGPRTGSCSASRNTGIDMATGEYIIFLDGDDTIVEGSLQRLHDKIAERPGADLYPCAMLVHNEITSKDEPTRDNFPNDFHGVLTGPEATLMTEHGCGNHPCPMLQLTIFRRSFLQENGLRCVMGLRRQDSEFSPRALYLASRVVPLHEPFYLYRIRSNAVGSSAKGPGYFHGDWAIIIRSLLAFHSKVSAEPGFDQNISRCWARQWIPWILYFWFHPKNMREIPRALRHKTLSTMFDDGFADFNRLLAKASPAKRFAGKCVQAFVAHPRSDALTELFFRLYFAYADRKHHEKSRATQ